MFLQETPPDTFGYMAFGFAVILGTIALYLISLRSRKRNLERDLELIDEIEAGEPTAVDTTAAAPS